MTSSYSPSLSRPAPVPKKRAPYPHLSDLVDRVNAQLRDRNKATIKGWLDEARVHWQQAQWHRTTGKLDQAYVDYMMAFEIVANKIPGHQDYPTVKQQGTELFKQYSQLRNELKFQTNEFNDAKEAIKRDNEKSGVVALQNKAAAVNGSAPQDPSRRAPEVRAKPGHLASKSASAQMNAENGTQSSNSEDLQSRFQRLSMKSNSPRPNSISTNGLPASLIPGIGATTEVRHPQGPRQMPTKPLNIDIENTMPCMPARTYSPLASYASPGGLSPPRSSTRNLANSYVQPEARPRPPPPAGMSITPEALQNYLKVGSVLLLDVRPRSEFEHGHIFAKSVVCIDPIALREGMSAEQIEEALILGPSKEYDLFKARDQMDLIVYYDQSTSDTNYLTSTVYDPGVKHLVIVHKAFVEYNYEKVLQTPPILLLGGLDAWIDHFGLQSLKTEEPESAKVTAQPTRSLNRWSREVRTPSPLLLERRSIATKSPPYPTSLRVGTAIPSEPINIEEEQEWLRQLKKDSGPLAISTPPSETDQGRRRRGTFVVGNATAAAPYARNVEEYFQQYPASPYAQESMSIPAFPPPDTPVSPNRGTNTIIDHPFHVFTDVRNPEFNPPPPPSRPPPVAPRKSYSGVSERPGSTAPVVPQRPPKIAHRSISNSGNMNFGTTGLKNLGNTCYMNSVLQCLSGTVPLSRYFLDGSYKSHVNKQNPLGSRGVLAEAYATVVRHLWSAEYSFISPVTFKDVAGRLNETFRSDSQQDAQEFLEFLVDALHEDLNPNATKHKLQPLTDDDERIRETLPVQIASAFEWSRYIHSNTSVAVNWLQGQLSSRLTCLSCRITSTTYAPFTFLSLPIPQFGGPFNLDDCLREFTKEEILDEHNTWSCPSCKCKRRASKKLTITRLPHILIIHLKRFANQGRWRDKLNTPIDFPLSGLNLTSYVPPAISREELEGVRPSHVEAFTTYKKGDGAQTPPFYYDLYGVVNHYGSLHGGHYTAFVKDSYRDMWNSFDDSQARGMPEDKVVSKAAYVLFWVRKNVM